MVKSVLQAPKDAILLANSLSSPNELFLVNDNILAIQSHPELSPELVIEKIYPALLEKGKIREEETDNVIQSLLTKNDHPSLLSALHTFLTE